MIYLIKSASWNKEKNSFEFILKIGYTKDTSAQNRFSSYINHNPTVEILFKIPNATREQESLLHKYFKGFRIHGNEWYEYREEIINFFTSHTTRKSLNSVIIPEEPSNISKAKEFSEFVDTVENLDLKKRLLTYLELSSQYLRLKFLYLLSKDDLLSEEILSKIPDDNFLTYFSILGPERIKALGYNVTKLNKELGIVSFDKNKLNLLIFKSFNIGDRLSLSNIKIRLKEIYSNCGFNKTAKANDLEIWFEIKEIFVTDHLDNGSKKRGKGYEILSKKQ